MDLSRDSDGTLRIRMGSLDLAALLNPYITWSSIRSGEHKLVDSNRGNYSAFLRLGRLELLAFW